MWMIGSMTKKSARVEPTKATREQVMSEYRHRCAICGADRPHLHHIDEDPSNNDLQNLLPLCPNHHLSDTHDPTAPINPLKLQLLRKYKDPLILSPQFEPIFRRLLFLICIQECEPESAEYRANELALFMGQLELGGYYQAKLHALICRGMKSSGVMFMTEDGTKYDMIPIDPSEYEIQLQNNAAEAIELCVEALRYQRWELPTRRG
jgi:hypothetical protein